MADQTQIIKVIYEATQAQKDAAKFASDEQKRTRETAAEAKKAAKETAAAQEKAAKEAAAAKVKAAREAADAAKKSAKELTDAERKEAANRESIERLTDRGILKEYRDRIAFQIRETRRLASEEKKAALESAREKEKAAKMATQAWDAQSVSIMSATKSMAMFVAGSAGITGVVQALHMVVEQFNAVRVAGVRAAQDVLDEAGEMRSLAAMTGQLGQPSQKLFEQLQLRTRTLQTSGEARQMTEQAMASAAGSITAGLITDAEFQKHLIVQGQLQKMTGAAPEAVGIMAGIMPEITGKKVNTAEDLNVLAERLFEQQRLGGFLNYGVAAKQFAQASEYVTKGVYKAGTMQALLSAFAKSGQGETAAERVSQVTTSVSAGLIRNRGMQVMPEYETDTQRSGEYFKSLGISPKDKPEDRIMAVVNDLMRAEDKTLQKGENWDPMIYLVERGFNNVQSRESLAKLAGVERQGGQLTSLLRLGAAPLPKVSGIPAQFEEFRTLEPWAAQEQAKAETRLKEFKGGLAGGAGPFMNIMRQRAYGAMGGEAALGHPLETITGRSPWDPHELMFGQRAALDMEAQRQIVASARRIGVEVPAFERYDPKTGAKLSDEQLPWDKLFKIALDTRSAGGTLFPTTDAAKTHKVLEEIRDGIRMIAPSKPPLPAALPARVAAPALRAPGG